MKREIWIQPFVFCRGEMLFLRPAAPLINSMTGKWNTTGTSSRAKGPFFNYVDQNLPIFDHLPTPLLTSVKEFLYIYNGKSALTFSVLPTYLVNVVKERPPNIEEKDWQKCLGRLNGMRFFLFFFPSKNKEDDKAKLFLAHLYCA